jgi:hypothetical protein
MARDLMRPGFAHVEREQLGGGRSFFGNAAAFPLDGGL